MASSSVDDFPAEQKKILMRKLQFISEEHRNYLLKTYDLAGISLRINRYLTMARKAKTMEQHGDQCKVIYDKLHKGFDQDLQSIFGNDSSMPHYGTFMPSHGSNDNKPTMLVEKMTNEVPEKRISFETYKKRQQEDINNARTHQEKSGAIGSASRPETSPKFVQEIKQNIQKRSLDRAKNMNVPAIHCNAAKIKEHLSVHANKIGPLPKLIKKSEKDIKEQCLDKIKATTIKEHLLAHANQPGPLPKFVAKSEGSTKERPLNKVKDVILPPKTEEHMLTNADKPDGPSSKLVKQDKKEQCLDKTNDTDIVTTCQNNADKLKEHWFDGENKLGPLPKFLLRCEQKDKQQSSDMRKTEVVVNKHEVTRVKAHEKNKIEPLSKVYKNVDKKQPLNKARVINATSSHHKRISTKNKNQLLNDANNANNIGSLQKVCKKIEQNNKERSENNKARVVIVTSPHHQRGGEKFKKRTFNNTKQVDSLQKVSKKIDQKNKKQNKRPLEKAKVIKAPQRYEVTNSIAPRLEEIIKVDALQTGCKRIVEKVKERSTAETIDVKPTYHKTSAVKIEKQRSNNAEKIDSSLSVSQKYIENYNNDERSLDKVVTNITVSKSKTKNINEQRLTKASNFKTVPRFSPCNQIHRDLDKTKATNATPLHHEGSATITKKQELDKTTNHLVSLQMFCKQTVQKTKKRSLDSTDMIGPLTKYVRKSEQYDNTHMLDNSSYASNGRYSLDNTVNIIPSYSKKRSLDISNDASVVKKLKIDFTITTD